MTITVLMPKQNFVRASFSLSLLNLQHCSRLLLKAVIRDIRGIGARVSWQLATLRELKTFPGKRPW